jgi:hypothetical protein
MPRRLDPSQCRTTQVSFLCRADDLARWTAEAKRKRMSLSRCLWLLAVRAQPPLNEAQQEAVAQLPRISANLNQVAHRLHMEGASLEVVAETMRVLHDLNMRLVCL